MSVETFLRKAHRIVAIGFLLSIPPAAYYSIRGDASSPFVYLPLVWLLGLTVSGVYMLVKPWVRSWRARSAKP